jgi:hypothetical protein
MKQQAKIEQWVNNNAGEADIDPRLIMANPANIRVHDDFQRQVWREYVKKTGFLGRVLINSTTGLLLDGHLRVDEAILNKEPTVPVQYISLTPTQESVALVFYNQIGGLATLSLPKLEYSSQSITDMGKASSAFLEALPGFKSYYEQMTIAPLESSGDYDGLFSDSNDLGNLTPDEAPAKEGPLKIVLKASEAEEFKNFVEGLGHGIELEGVTTVLVIMSNR